MQLRSDNNLSAEIVKNGFVKRAVVVISVVGFVLLILWVAPALVFNLGVAIVVVLATHEVHALNDSSYQNSYLRRFGLVAAALLSLQMIFLPRLPVWISLSMLLVLLFSTVVVKTRGPSISEFHEFLFVTFGLLYIGGMFGTLILIRDARFGRELTFILIMVVLAREVGAYFGGKIFRSGTLLNAALNSKKNYQGAALGTVVTVGMAIALSTYFDVGLTIYRAILLGGLVAVACQLGDLSESYLKRALGRRHSGNLLGPEGGLLDFLDAATFAIVVVFMLISIWGY